MKTKNETVTVPAEIASQIKYMQEDGVSNWRIMELISQERGYAKLNAPAVIKRFKYGNMDELMAALVVGYRVEKSPEEKLQDYYSQLVIEEQNANVDRYSHYYSGCQHGIKQTLAILGITIEGINA